MPNGTQLFLSAAEFPKKSTLYVNVADLISFLESCLKKYEEEVFDSRTFDQWRTDLITEQKELVELEEQAYFKDGDLEVEESHYNVLMNEQKILNALFSDPVQLETAGLFYQLRSINLQSNEAFKKARNYSKEYRTCNSNLQAYTTAESERTKAKKAYNEARDLFSEKNDNPQLKNQLKKLYDEGLKKKDFSKACLENLTSTYGSLELAREFQKQRSSARDAMRESALYFKKRALRLTDANENKLGIKEVYDHTCAATFDLLAQDYFALAHSIIQKNQTSVDHIKKLISIALQAKSIFDEQLSVLRSLENKNFEVADKLSLTLLGEAGSLFLSAYHSLKNQETSTLLQARSQELQDLGSNLTNVALIFQASKIPDGQKSSHHRDLVEAQKRALHHAELVTQKDAANPERLYHAKIASFLHDSVFASKQLIEISNLKTTCSNQSPTFYFLEEAASLFEKSRISFLELTQLPFKQLDPDEVQLRAKTAAGIKDQASHLLSQVKKLSSPSSAASGTPQNEDLPSWSN